MRIEFFLANRIELNQIKSIKNQMRIEKCPDDSHENYENVVEATF
jgi:hypothetical protein